MSTSSKIEWTEQTWNPTVGCTKISPGCKHCYAEKMALRLQAMGMRGYENGFGLSLMPERLAVLLQAVGHMGAGRAKALEENQRPYLQRPGMGCHADVTYSGRR